ncbi:hypothetical protein [Methylobacterium aquaticum]|uniref:hypothetical protein n=1 Tax=Methylobacterium aquaticum TaxID=270351 RepID=UPI001FED8C3A|nr:hypothetical protein [Methylobacterium aquaticum]
MRHWLRAGTAPTWHKGERARIIDPFVPYLVRRLDEGERNATQLWRELQASGFRGGVMSVRLCVAALGGPPRTRPASNPVWRRPSPRRAARLLLTDGEHGEMDGHFLDALVAAVPEIERALAEVKAFTVIVREQDQAGFGAWLDRCRDAR